MRSSPKENQSLEVKVKGISEMEFSLSIFDYTFANYSNCLLKCDSTQLARVCGKKFFVGAGGVWGVGFYRF